MLTIKNESDIAQIYLSGDIVDDDEGGFINYWYEGDTTGYEFPAKFRKQLDAVKDKALEIHINSAGGSVFAGVAMANFVRDHKPPTTAIIDGIAASIASQIFFSADVCKIPANGYVMIHRPFSRIEGNAEDLRKAAEVLDTIQAGLIETYKPKMKENFTVDSLREMMNAEKWFRGTEAAEYFKVEVIQPVKAVNCALDKNKLIAAGIRNLPAPLNFLPEKENLQDTSLIGDKEKIKITLARAKAALL